MAIKKLTLTEDHIKLIRALNPVKFEFEDADDRSHFEESLPGTQDDFAGRRYPKEKEDYMLELYSFFEENMLYIESLVHQFCDKGGLTPGTYKCIDYQLNWEKID